MPYSNVSELPDAVKGNLPPEAQRMWMHVFNSSYDGRCKGDDGCAAQAAWGVVHKHYHKDENGKWVANKSEVVEFSLTITKASFDPKTNQRRFVATASDTDMDSFGESMSMELFNDFIDRANRKEKPPEYFCSEFWSGGMPYLSVAHYFDLDGRGAVGTVSDIYIDGKQLKAKGVFLNTPLAIAAYEAVKRSINEKAEALDDAQKKIRISIAFLDYGHQHGENPPFFRRAGTNVRCPYCADGQNSIKYLKGHLIHLALTRVPVNTRTEIIGGEVDKSMAQIQTRKDDAASIVGEELAEELEKESQLVGKSEVAELVVKSEEEPEEVVEAEEPESTLDEDDYIDILVGDEPESDVEEVEDAISARKDVSPADKKRAEKEYGGGPFADTKNKKYALDNEKHIRAAWSYINMPKNQKKYSASEVATIKRKIIAAWKRKIDAKGPPEAAAKKSETEISLVSVEPILERLEKIEKMLAETKPAPVEVVAEEVHRSQIQTSADEFVKVFESLVDQGLQGDALLQQVQAPFEQFGTAIKEYAISLSKAPEQPAESSMLDDIRKAVAEAVTPLQNELTLVKSQLSAVTQAQTVVQASAPAQVIRPTPRGLTALNVNPMVLRTLQEQEKPRDPNKPLSLREIAIRSANAR